MNKIVSIIVLLSFVTLQSCSAFKSSTQTVNIQCDQQETTIIVNGEPKPCPSQMEVKRNRDVNIQAHKVGYLSNIRTIGYHLSASAVFDILGTFIIYVPVIGILTPGAGIWMKQRLIFT